MIKQSILVTVDNVIFTVEDDTLKVLLIQRAIEPFKWSWALPGGFVLEKEDLMQAAERELEEEANVKNVYLEQLYTFGTPKRDPRWRVVTVAYMALVARENLLVKAWSDAQAAMLFPVNKLPKLSFDHAQIVAYALNRLQWKLEYTNVAQYLLPKLFPLSSLQRIYEIAFDKPFDVRNFRKKILGMKIVKESWQMLRWQKNRPAMLYEFVDKKVQIMEIL